MTRLRIFTLSAIVLMALGAAAGYQFGRSEYRVVGILSFNPVTPKVLYTLDRDIGPNYSYPYIDSQVEIIRSHRVIGSALEAPQWRSLNKPLPTDFSATLDHELRVTRSGQLIYVAVTDADQTVAATAVTTIIQAYQKSCADESVEEAERRIVILKERKVALTGDLATKQQRIRQIAEGYGTDDLKPKCQFEQERLNRIDSAIDEKKLALVVHPGDKQLTDQIAALQHEWSSLNERLKAIGSDMLKLEQLRQEADELRKSKEETDIRIDQLNLEAQVNYGLMRVLSLGEPDPHPYRDTHVRRAIFGACVGMVLAPLLAFVFGSKPKSKVSPSPQP